MSSATTSPRDERHKMTPADRKVLLGTLVGTSIEWYDFIIYAQAAGLVFSGLFFAPMAANSPALGLVLSLSSISVSFLVRPLGAVVAGRLGDKLGRKGMLVFTLVLMGVSTTLIGVLPTFAQIGVWAPLLLILLRILQGFSAGGEWGGAALLSVEHAPSNRRGFFGAYPQIGVPIGIILGTGVSFVVSSLLSPEQYLTWGWRVPFLLSVALIVVGFLIRRAVDESPVFVEMRQRKQQSSAPLRDVFNHHWRTIVLTALIFAANSAGGNILIAFLVSYAVGPAGKLGLGMDRTSVLLASTLGYFGFLIFTMYGGILSDRIGRVRTFQIGYALIFAWMIPMFLLVGKADIWLYGIAVFVFSIGLGLSYGPMSAMYAEMFPVEIRYSGIAIGNALGAVLGGAFSATVAQLLLTWTERPDSVGIYMMVMAVISFAAVTTVKESKGRSLRVETVREQSASETR